MFRQVKSGLEQLFNAPRPPIILILGLRQTGKSTLATTLVANRPHVRFNFDLLADQQTFVKPSRHDLTLFHRQHNGQIVIIDEVQKVPTATGVVKHLYDTYRMTFVLTGSSELKLRSHLGDTLTGRVHEVHLFPLSLSEINIQSGLPFDPHREFNNYDENQELLLRCLVYGSLPELQNIPFARYASYLTDYTNNLFSKDILDIAGTRKPTQIFALAKLLALQIGQLVNFNELATNTELSRETVYRYIDIFRQIGLITPAQPISTNQRQAISKKAKFYFTDLGIRNALLNAFSDFRDRPDRGQLLENTVFVGIKRSLIYHGVPHELGFFRSPHGAEIDIVKKVDSKEELLEVKVSAKPSRRLRHVTLVTLDTAQKYLY